MVTHRFSDALVTAEIVTYAIVTPAAVTDAMVAFLLELEELKDLLLDQKVSKPKRPNSCLCHHVHNHNHRTTLHQLQYIFYANMPTR